MHTATVHDCMCSDGVIDEIDEIYFIFGMRSVDCRQMLELFSSINQEKVRIFQSNGRTVFIHFHANEENLGFGFIMSYIAVPEQDSSELLTGLM